MEGGLVTRFWPKVEQDSCPWKHRKRLATTPSKVAGRLKRRCQGLLNRRNAPILRLLSLPCVSDVELGSDVPSPERRLDRNWYHILYQSMGGGPVVITAS